MSSWYMPYLQDNQYNYSRLAARIESKNQVLALVIRCGLSDIAKFVIDLVGFANLNPESLQGRNGPA